MHDELITTHSFHTNHVFNLICHAPLESEIDDFIMNFQLTIINQVPRSM